jgi:hypothetical protein
MQIPPKHRVVILSLLITQLGVWIAQESTRADDLPLRPTRTLSFATDEGTWISTDVSPDGEERRKLSLEGWPSTRSRVSRRTADASLS